LRVDGSVDREFRKAFQSYLRSKVPKGVIKDCKFRDSKREVCQRLATHYWVVHLQGSAIEAEKDLEDEDLARWATAHLIRVIGAAARP
jgi:hypothetical protein